MAERLKAQGDRSVVVGRDVINSIIVTGDHNQVFTGDYERLRDAYIEPWSVFERVNLDHFVGREWLLAEVDAFLRDNDRGHFILEAEAGLGKTTFLAWLVRERGYIHHFTELAPGPDGVGRGLKNLAAQVVLAYHLSAWEAEGVLPGAAARPDYLSRLLKLAADQRQVGEEIVLVVDALDEAGTPPGQNVLGLPQVLPEGVFLIVSQRPVPVTLHVETASTPRRCFALAAGSKKNLADMRRFLERAATWPGVAQALGESRSSAEQFTTTLLDKCRGVWIYLHYVIHEIERGERSPLDLEALPDGMTQYYASYWRRWRDKDEERWYEVHLPLLSTLAAAQEAVSATRLADWARVKTPLAQLRRLLNERWRPFLTRISQREQAYYRLYHATLREFFEGKVERDTLKLAAEASLVEELVEATRQAHNRLVERYLDAWGGLGKGLPGLSEATKRDLDDGYGLRHMAAHLEASGRVEDLHRLLALETSEGRNAWYETRDTMGDTAGYLTDVYRAGRLAEEEFADLQSPISIGLQCRYALVTASLNSLASNIPPSLLVALVHKGVWPPVKGLTYARQIPDPRQQAEVLVWLAPTLPEPLLQDALATAQQIENKYHRSQALTGLVTHFSEMERAGILVEAQEVAQRIEDKWNRVETLVRLAHRLAELGYHEEALAVTRELPKGFHFGSSRSKTVAELTPYLPEPLQGEALREALAAAREDGNKWTQANALAALTPHLPEPLLKEGLAVVWGIEDEQKRAEALAGLVPRLSEPLKGDVLREALGTARGIGDEQKRVKALAGLVPHLSDSLKGDVLQEALAAALEIDNEGERAEALLVSLIPWLAELGYVQEALVAAREIDVWDRVLALLYLSARMPESAGREMVLQEALAAAKETEDETARAIAVSLATSASETVKQEMVSRAVLAAFQTIEDAHDRASLLAFLGFYLAKPLPCLRVILTGTYDEGDHTKTIMNGLVSLPNNLLKEMLIASQKIGDGHSQTVALIGLSHYLLEPLSYEATQRLLTAARDYGEMAALAELAPQLPAGMAKDVLREILAVRPSWIIRIGATQPIEVTLPEDTFEAVIRAMVQLGDTSGLHIAFATALAVKRGGVFALGRLAKAWAELGYLEEAYTASRNALRIIQEADNEADVISQFIPYLPEPKRTHVLQKALMMAQVIEDASTRVQALTGLAPYLSESSVEQVLDEELGTKVWDTGSAGYRAELLLGLAPYLSESLREQSLHKGLAAAREIRDEKRRAEALARFVTYLPETERNKVLHESLAAVRKMWNSDKQTQTLMELVPYLTQLPCNTLYPLWREVIHVLSVRTRRPDLLADIRTLGPFITALGGAEAVTETFGAIQDVGRWWP